VNEDTLYRDATATLKKTEKAMEGLGDSGQIYKKINEQLLIYE
jgi:phospholipid/cholesterol/gamma-HCH transport system substrate-binding protein